MAPEFSPEHVYPAGERQAHTEGDWCLCRPRPAHDEFGGLIWIHNKFLLAKTTQQETDDLLDQAERIRAAESARLFNNIAATSLKFCSIVPWASNKPIQLPKSSGR